LLTLHNQNSCYDSIGTYDKMPSMREFIYVDDSGDAGLRNSHTDKLIVAAVIIIDEDKRAALNDAINLYRKDLGWHELDEFKFAKTNKAILVDLIKHIKDYDYKAHVVVLDKNEIDIDSIPKEKVSVYNHVLKELLLRVGKDRQFITIDGKHGKKHDAKVRVYLRNQLKENGIMSTDIKFVDSRKDSLVQLADIVVGAVARSYKDKSDSQRYIELLKEKILDIEKISI